MRHPTGVAGAVLAAAVLLSGCAPGPGGPEGDAGTGAGSPGPARVDVDTPELRRAKRDIGMADCRPGDGTRVAGGLPELTLPCLGGGPEVEMSALRGPLVLNVWQSYCGPCREEMPALQEFHERYGDRVRVLGIDYQDVRPEAAMELARETGVTYPSVADPGGELNGLGELPPMRGAPFFVLVDAEGRIAHWEAGGVESAGEVVDMVEQHLGVAL